MVAVAWSAIGLLVATLLGSFFYLGNRIDGLGNRIDNLGSRLDGRLDSVAARLDALGARLDAHIERHAG
jgi:hypothetical protein